MLRKDKNKIRVLSFRFIERNCNLEKVCQVCGATKAEIHHIDYNDIYNIHLLCRKCHTAIHKSEIFDIPVINLLEHKKNKPLENKLNTNAIKTFPLQFTADKLKEINLEAERQGKSTKQFIMDLIEQELQNKNQTAIKNKPVENQRTGD